MAGSRNGEDHKSCVWADASQPSHPRATGAEREPHRHPSAPPNRIGKETKDRSSPPVETRSEPERRVHRTCESAGRHAAGLLVCLVLVVTVAQMLNLRHLRNIQEAPAQRDIIAIH